MRRKISNSEMPVVRITTSSLFRASWLKVKIAPASTAKGATSANMNGKRRAM